nr:hypothetical protein [Hyphomonas sp. Mor2]
MSLKPNPIRLSASFAIALAICGATSAGDSFCISGGTCTQMTIENVSAALVTSVKIEQHTTDGACQYADSTFSQNLNGMFGESYDVSVNSKCKYKIKFHTTSGCSGDKTTHITPGNFDDRETTAQLKGNCGTLKTKTY